MAANPITGIDFALDRFVIRKGGAIVNFSAPWLRLDGGPVVDGFPTGEYRDFMTAHLRLPAELKAQVDHVRIAANNSVYPPTDKDALAALVADAKDRVAGGTATAVDSVILERHALRMDQMRQNEERAMALYSDIDAEREYDITLGWQRGTAQEE